MPRFARNCTTSSSSIEAAAGRKLGRGQHRGCGGPGEQAATVGQSTRPIVRSVPATTIRHVAPRSRRCDRPQSLGQSCPIRPGWVDGWGLGGMAIRRPRHPPSGAACTPAAVEPRVFPHHPSCRMRLSALCVCVCVAPGCPDLEEFATSHAWGPGLSPRSASLGRDCGVFGSRVARATAASACASTAPLHTRGRRVEVGAGWALAESASGCASGHCWVWVA